MTETRDLTPDNGHAPPFAKTEPKLGEIGSGGGYSGQEYDSVGQEAWRARDAARNVAPDGVARGTGSPGEEIDRGTPGSTAQDADEADSNGQQNVEDRPNVGTVTPEDYPEQK